MPPLFVPIDKKKPTFSFNSQLDNQDQSKPIVSATTPALPIVAQPEVVAKPAPVAQPVAKKPRQTPIKAAAAPIQSTDTTPSLFKKASSFVADTSSFVADKANFVADKIENLYNPTIDYNRDEYMAKQTGVVRGVNIKSYATDPTHEVKIAKMSNQIAAAALATTSDINSYIHQRAPLSHLAGEWFAEFGKKYQVDVALALAIMQNDSGFGTKGKGARTRNPGNVGNDDAGNTQNYKSWKDGTEAVFKWLSKHKTQ